MIDAEEVKKVIVRRRLDIIIGLILAFITLAAVVVMLKYFVQTDGTKARPVGLPIPVQTQAAEVVKLHVVIGASGATAESTDAFLTNRVIAKVLEVPVDVGKVVRKGDLLAAFDDSLFRAAVDHARVNLDHTDKQLERMLTMQKKGFASAIEVENARTADAAAKEALVEAEFNLTNTRINSPASAIVLQRNVNPGEITTVGTPAFKLGIIEPVYMVAQVSQEKIGSVHIGMQADVSTDGFPGVIFTGHVVKIDGNVNDVTRTFGVYISIANSDLRLIPGITGYARLKSEQMALAVPSTAVLNPVGDRAIVFVVDKDNRAHIREVRRGLMAGGMTELIDGVQEGEQVVTVGQQELRDNDRVLANQSAPWNK
ncbi:MAG: efflux RND transporter periplasmic adaptor subunit [Verrucomicrobia bacterium]|nr:efflux RND transporter periplasmic adaptor subunit [Verrucomicrobiota bacterium]